MSVSSFLFFFFGFSLVYIACIQFDSFVALSTFSCVHCFLTSSRCNLNLLIPAFKHSYFLCCLILSFSMSIVPTKNSSLFNIFSASYMIFITYWNRQHMTNNMTCRGINENNTSAIFLERHLINWYYLGSKIYNNLS